MKPTVPVRINAGCLILAVKDNPTTAAVFGFVKDISLGIVTDTHTVTMREPLGTQCLAVPPSDRAQKCLQHTHHDLRRL
jgi:hypothetical protein